MKTKKQHKSPVFFHMVAKKKASNLFHIKPVCTVCLVQSDNKVGRGISICSKKDNFRYKYGRDKAMGRAIKALCGEKDSEPVRRPEAWQVYFSSHRPNDFNKNPTGLYKSSFFHSIAQLSPFEQTQINKK